MNKSILFLFFIISFLPTLTIVLSDEFHYFLTPLTQFYLGCGLLFTTGAVVGVLAARLWRRFEERGAGQRIKGSHHG
ncbi:hypothetical protein [Nitratireductor aquibiodomus]|uniref:hypothetical protein n=1 Tax=Nitratireductor aquibiodomus TaxID=204799 RepID=UPI0004698F95|nr:hypothetical protein [Nitratireductor aquibiodomus]